MSKQLTFDRLKLEWSELRPGADGSFSFRFAAKLTNADGEGSVLTYDGWDGVTAAQRTALRTAIGAVLKARMIAILGTNTATHDLVVTGGEFTEKLKGV